LGGADAVDPAEELVDVLVEAPESCLWDVLLKYPQSPLM